MGIFDGLKRFAGRVWGGIKSAGGRVLDIGNKIRDGINKGYNIVKKIPVVGNVVDKMIDTPIPLLGGMSLKNIAGTANTALDVGNDIGRITGMRNEGRDTGKLNDLVQKRTGKNVEEVRRAIENAKKGDLSDLMNMTKTLGINPQRGLSFQAR
jgi:hypothetical protein